LLSAVVDDTDPGSQDSTFERLVEDEKKGIFNYIIANKKHITTKYQMDMPSSRIEIVAEQYGRYAVDISRILKKIKTYYDQIKSIELQFLKSHDINLVLDDTAIDYIIANIMGAKLKLKELFKRLSDDFEHGLKLVRDKTGRNRFFITKEALISPETYIEGLIKNQMQVK